MKISTILLALLLSLTACEKDIVIPKPDAAADISYADHPRHVEYQGQLDNFRKTTNSPGAILLLQRQGEPLWVGASGSSNLEHQTPMRTNTPFRVGSITKTFVATAVLYLVEEGKLSLDDKLSERLPKVIGKIPKAEKITVRHLLGHLSGIFDPANESRRYQLEIVNDPAHIDAMSIDELMEEYVFGEPLHFEPGTAYSYSNANFWLLGQIMEDVTRKTLQQVLDELIFTPLELTGTYLERRDDRNVARGYADLYGDGKLLDVSQWDRADTDGKADGGIVSTATDLMKFMRALMAGEIISPTSVDLMKQVQLDGCDNIFCEYGLGLELWRTGAGIGFGHNGGSVGIEANVVYYPESGNVFVTYKNNGNGSDKSFLDALMK
ncbi:MAG: beta-lactamase family protein [Saprospiraceae bacterium]|nr:beta-lactamase family protein [Saprospiraceae bacterium]